MNTVFEDESYIILLYFGEPIIEGSYPKQ